MSTFSSINAANTALWAAQRGLDVTGQNVANANTDGYSRQNVQQSSISGNTVPAMFATNPSVGMGVQVDDVVRTRDMLLEAQKNAGHANSGALAARDASMTQIQAAFREPTDSGLQNQMDTMFAGWGDVANNPQDPGARTALLEQTQNVVASMHATVDALNTQWTQVHENLQALVTNVNSTTAQIADLNTQIQQASAAKLDTNELADKRDLLVSQLATQMGATTRTGDDGMLSVFIGGTPVVFGGASTALQVSGGGSPSVVGTTPVTITPATGNYALDLTGGTAGGNLATLNGDIPTYLGKLDGIAATLAGAINSGQASGWDAAGNNPAQAMFSTGGAPGPITAANITVNLTDPNGIAASGQPPQPATPPATGLVPSVDGSNADAMAQLQYNAAGPSASYRQAIVDLGVQAQGVSTSLQVQNTITGQLDSAVQSNSGVNVDEEMSNMMAYQHSYEAAAKLMNSINATLDSLLNMI